MDVKAIVRLRNGEKQQYKVNDMSSHEEAIQTLKDQISDLQCVMVVVPSITKIVKGG